MLTPWKALLLPLAGVLAFCLIGAIIGASIGLIAPDYYRTVVHNSDAPSFDPLQVGVGLGMTQGASAGAVIGLAALAIMAWRDIRRIKLGQESIDSSSKIPKSGKLAKWLFFALGISCLMLFTIVLSGAVFVVGAIVGESGNYRRSSDRFTERVQRILSEENLGDLEVIPTSQGQVQLIGSVESAALRTDLETQLVREFGVDEAAFIISNVNVRPAVE